MLLIIRRQKPNKQVMLTPSKEYNPRDSATWMALQETDEKIDPEKIKNYSSLKEHDAVFSEVYAAPGANGQPFLPRSRSPAPNPSGRQTRSPVAEFLPPHLGGGPVRAPPEENPEDKPKSAVLLAALSESKTSSDPNHFTEEIPIYETNSLGEKRRITQSASFNKLMMDILGE